MRSISARLILILAVLSMFGTMAARRGWGPGLVLLQENPPLDEEGYWQLVRRSRDLVTSLKGRSAGEIKDELAGLAGEWEIVREVRIEDGQLVPVDHGYLLVSLRADPPRLDEITELLESLLFAHEKYPDEIFSAAELASLRVILERPEFNWPVPQPNPLNEWLKRMWERFNKWLGSLFDTGPIEIPVDLNLLPLIAAILLSTILLLVFRTLLSDFVKEGGDASDLDGEDEPLTSKTAFEKAQALSRGGDFRSAVRYLYLSSLLVLDERGLLRYDRTKTNREYLRSISNSPALAKPLEQVIEVFDDVWYGHHSLEEETFKHYSDRVRELKENKG